MPRIRITPKLSPAKTLVMMFIVIFPFLVSAITPTIQPNRAVPLSTATASSSSSPAERKLSSRVVTTKYGALRGFIVTLPNRSLQQVEIFMGEFSFFSIHPLICYDSCQKCLPFVYVLPIFPHGSTLNFQWLLLYTVVWESKACGRKRRLCLEEEETSVMVSDQYMTLKGRERPTSKPEKKWEGNWGKR